MQISIETLGALERRLTISVDSETFESEITKRLQKTGKQIRLPGFRAGKVPLKEVRRRFGPSIRAEVAGEFMQNSFVEAVQQEQFTPAGSPNLEVIKMDPGIDFEFIATFEVYPSIELGDLSKLALVRPQAEINESDIDEMVEKLREQRKTFETVERSAVDGDQVKVDFVGRLDGEEFDGGRGDGVQFVIGAGQMIESFDAGIIGQRAGESTVFDAVFPDDYQADHLKGRTVQFEVVVHEVGEPRIPELDEAFFQDFGVHDGGLAAFRQNVRENMQREMETAVKNQLSSQIMDQLGQMHEIQIPKAMVQRELEALKGQMFQKMGMPVDPERLASLPDEPFIEQAERRVTVGLVVSEIVKTHNITATPEKVRAKIEAMAATYSEPQQVINYYYSNSEQLQQIEMTVLEEEVVEFVINQAQVTDTDGAYTEVIGGQMIPKLESAKSEDSAL